MLRKLAQYASFVYRHFRAHRPVLRCDCCSIQSYPELEAYRRKTRQDNALGLQVLLLRLDIGNVCYTTAFRVGINLCSLKQF